MKNTKQTVIVTSSIDPQFKMDKSLIDQLKGVRAKIILNKDLSDPRNFIHSYSIQGNIRQIKHILFDYPEFTLSY